MKACPEGKIRNPATNRCVDANGKIGRMLKAPASQEKKGKCPEGKVLNPATKRCVDNKGKVGKAILAKGSPKKPVTAEKSSKNAAKKAVKLPSVVRPMSLADIRKQMPGNVKAHEQEDGLYLDDMKALWDTENERHVQKVYGRAAMALTIDLAKTLKGQSVYVLQGQSWGYWEKNNWNSLDFKMKDIERVKLVRFVDPFDDHSVQDFEAGDEPELELDDETRLYVYNEKYVSGSGADPFYVFVERRQAVANKAKK